MRRRSEGGDLCDAGAAKPKKGRKRRRKVTSAARRIRALVSESRDGHRKE